MQPQGQLKPQGQQQGPLSIQHHSQLSCSLGPGVAMPLAGQQFSVTRPLGKGSFGVVWEAQDQTGRAVALKEIRCRSEKEIARVKAEGAILEVVNKEVLAAGLSRSRVPDLVATE